MCVCVCVCVRARARVYVCVCVSAVDACVHWAGVVGGEGRGREPRVARGDIVGEGVYWYDVAMTRVCTVQL